MNKRIIFAELEAKVYIFLSKIDLKDTPKSTKKLIFDATIIDYLKTVYPEANKKELKRMKDHLAEYYTIVLKKEL